jgi:hypothetical protein
MEQICRHCCESVHYCLGVFLEHLANHPSVSLRLCKHHIINQWIYLSSLPITPRLACGSAHIILSINLLLLLLYPITYYYYLLGLLSFYCLFGVEMQCYFLYKKNLVIAY